VGTAVGTAVGLAVGLGVGKLVGFLVGSVLGVAEGSKEGTALGWATGAGVGLFGLHEPTEHAPEYTLDTSVERQNVSLNNVTLGSPPEERYILLLTA